jgi:molybdopterin-containing oxidoreductase family membrane subunit
MSYDWPIVVGGKPIGSVIPYVVIAFELTILFGAGATILGLVFHSLKSRQRGAYDGSCTDDRIGIFVPCPAERRTAVEDLLNASGAEEVRVEA